MKKLPGTKNMMNIATKDMLYEYINVVSVERKFISMVDMIGNANETVD